MVCILLLAVLLSSLPLGASAGAPPAGWYVRRNHDGAQPAIDPQFSYIEKYNAYYVDKTHTSETGDKVLYLTFDAGYENGNIEKILDIMKEEGASGAFFILDNLIKRNEALVRRMASEGHLVCNHTLRHRDMTKITDEAAFAYELSALEELYRERIGCEMTKYYRPPEGKISEESIAMAEKLGYTTVLWSLAYADWDNKNQPTPDAAMKKILENTHNGAIILLHPTSATNAAILRSLIRTWRKMGYRFGTLDELAR